MCGAMISRIKKWLKRRNENKRVFCKIQLGGYVYTITAIAKRIYDADPAYLLWRCQSLANHLKVNDEVDQRIPEAIAEDWFKGQLEMYGTFSQVEVTWKEVSSDATKT